MAKAEKRKAKQIIVEPITEAEEFNTQEPDGPVEEVDEFDFEDEEFKKLIEEYATSYEGDDDEDSMSVNDDGKNN